MPVAVISLLMLLCLWIEKKKIFSFLKDKFNVLSSGLKMQTGCKGHAFFLASFQVSRSHQLPCNVISVVAFGVTDVYFSVVM